MEIEPSAATLTSMVRWCFFILDTSDHKFDRSVLLRLARHQVAAFARFLGGFVHRIELEQATEAGADLLLDVAVPPIRGQAKGFIRLTVDGDIIRPFEPNDVIARNGVGTVTAGTRLF